MCCGAPFLSVLNTKSKWLSVDHPNGEKRVRIVLNDVPWGRIGILDHTVTFR